MRVGRRGGWALGLGLGLGLAMAPWVPACHRAFSCQQDAQCIFDGVIGRCEASGSCSFPDGECPTGRRYGEHAAAALVDECVEPLDGVTTMPVETDDECPPLVDSGPVVVTADGQVVEGLRITTMGTPGITVSGHSGVVIRNCEIHHQGGPGISFAAADDLTIDSVVVVHDRTEPGPHADANQVNITGTSSTGVQITRARVTRGASGIVLIATPGARLETIEGHDIRGPGPPASFIHLSSSSDVVIEDFSIINPLDTGRPDDLIEVNESSDVLIRDGLLDGHNSEFAYGVLFEQTRGQHSGGVVEDVDAIRMTAGAFSAFPAAYALVFRRTRVRENICEITSVPIEDCRKPVEGGGCTPGSDGRSWTGNTPVTGLLIEDSVFFDLCFSPVWPESSFLSCDGESATKPPGDCGLEEEDFQLRAPTVVQPCWEAG